MLAFGQILNNMKKDIHPTYTAEAKIACACGNSITTGSTKDSVSVELCSKCHPFYTGKQKIVDSARRVEKYEARNSAKSDESAGHKAKLAKKAARAKKREEKAIKDLPTDEKAKSTSTKESK